MEVIIMETREIMRIGERSLVECYTKGDFNTETFHKFVVCSNYNPAKAYGNQWTSGTYYNSWEDTRENLLIKANKELLKIEEHEVPYEDLLQATKDMKDALIADDEDNAMIWFKENLNNDILKLLDIQVVNYKIIEVTYTKKLYTTIKYVLKEDEDEYAALEDIDTYYLEFDDEDDWEYDYSSEIESGFNSDDVKKYINSHDVYNEDDWED